MACCTTDRIIDSHGQEMASFIPKSFTNCVLQKYIRTIKVFCIVTLKLKHIFIKTNFHYNVEFFFFSTFL